MNHSRSNSCCVWTKCWPTGSQGERLVCMWTMDRQGGPPLSHRHILCQGHPNLPGDRYHMCAEQRAERNYGKVDGESLGVLSGIKEHRMYLYRTRFTCMVDHQPLVPMYNSHSRELPARVARHKSKLTGFDFEVVYEPGMTTPSDYGSRNPRKERLYTVTERDKFGVETDEVDAEVMVARMLSYRRQSLRSCWRDTSERSTEY